MQLCCPVPLPDVTLGSAAPAGLLEHVQHLGLEHRVNGLHADARPRLRHRKHVHHLHGSRDVSDVSRCSVGSQLTMMFTTAGYDDDRRQQSDQGHQQHRMQVPAVRQSMPVSGLQEAQRWYTGDGADAAHLDGVVVHEFAKHEAHDLHRHARATCADSHVRHALGRRVMPGGCPPTLMVRVTGLR